MHTSNIADVWRALFGFCIAHCLKCDWEVRLSFNKCWKSECGGFWKCVWKNCFDHDEIEWRGVKGGETLKKIDSRRVLWFSNYSFIHTPLFIAIIFNRANAHVLFANFYRAVKKEELIGFNVKCRTFEHK